MSFNEGLERDNALRTARAITSYTPLDAARDLARLLSHVEQARQDAVAMAVWLDEPGGVGRALGMPNAPAFHLTAECDTCRRAAVWLKILNGAVG